MPRHYRQSSLQDKDPSPHGADILVAETDEKINQLNIYQMVISAMETNREGREMGSGACHSPFK